ncbi:MAG TPA: Gfo/Idh/MocA family oxidoreductase [Usitatibacter sp.]|nr:Gfo/Idh/MocA family oxidoreductase [Usitatibacter sp.]
MTERRQSKGIVRYAVVGQGYIAQGAVLPAFAHAKRNSRLVALVSGDKLKRRELSAKYGAAAYSYEEYDSLLQSGVVDAVYIALPNDQHRDFTLRAARRGVHVLCEKPLAVSERECRTMIAACRKHGVKLMTAYRLHFEQATLAALDSVGKGLIGEPRLFNSTFTMNVADRGNIRLQDPAVGGGTFYDIGIYCINAARKLFRSEPVEVLAMATAPGLGDAEESASAMLRFPGDRLATFCVSFAAGKTSEYRIVGAEGSIRAEPGYELASGLELHITRGDKKKTVKYRKRDQFAPELLYFSDCITKDREPEPSGEEGLADVRVIAALYKSARTGRAVRLVQGRTRRQPTTRQEIRRPPVRTMPKLINATPPSG